MDSYQPIYDAVRSRIGSTDVAQAIRDAFPSSEISHAAHMVQAYFQAAAAAMEAPSVIYKPKIYPDGDMWCALLGEDIQRGVCGFGKSPALAMEAFDKAWFEELKAPALGKEGDA